MSRIEPRFNPGAGLGPGNPPFKGATLDVPGETGTDGYHCVQPYLIFKNAAAAIAFCVQAFGATEKFRMAGPEGRIGHAEILIGDSTIMLADEAPQMDAYSPSITAALRSAC